MGLKMEKVGEMTGGFTHWLELCYPPSGQSWERGNGGRKTAQPHCMQVYPAFLKWWTKKPEERSCGEWVRGRQVPRLIPWPQWSLCSAVAFLDFPLHLNLKIKLWSSPSCSHLPVFLYFPSVLSPSILNSWPFCESPGSPFSTPWEDLWDRCFFAHLLPHIFHMAHNRGSNSVCL